MLCNTENMLIAEIHTEYLGFTLMTFAHKKLPRGILPAKQWPIQSILLARQLPESTGNKRVSTIDILQINWNKAADQLHQPYRPRKHHLIIRHGTQNTAVLLHVSGGTISDNVCVRNSHQLITKSGWIFVDMAKIKISIYHFIRY